MPINLTFLKLSRSRITGNFSFSHCCLLSSVPTLWQFSCAILQSGWLKVNACNCCFVLTPWRLIVVTKALKQKPPAESGTCRVTHVGCIFSFQVPGFLIFVFLLGTNVWFYQLYHMPQAGSHFNRHIYHFFIRFPSPVSLMSFHIWSTNGS